MVTDSRVDSYHRIRTHHTITKTLSASSRGCIGKMAASVLKRMLSDCARQRRFAHGARGPKRQHLVAIILSAGAGDAPAASSAWPW